MDDLEWENIDSEMMEGVKSVIDMVMGMQPVEVKFLAIQIIGGSSPNDMLAYSFAMLEGIHMIWDQLPDESKYAAIRLMDAFYALAGSTESIDEAKERAFERIKTKQEVTYSLPGEVSIRTDEFFALRSDLEAALTHAVTLEPRLAMGVLVPSFATGIAEFVTDSGLTS